MPPKSFSKFIQRWLKADPDGAGDDVILPKIEIGDRCELEKLEILNKETQPPNRFSEAGLIKGLEKRGIGRPSTYASIISTIQTREYVTLESKALKPKEFYGPFLKLVKEKVREKKLLT